MSVCPSVVCFHLASLPKLTFHMYFIVELNKNIIAIQYVCVMHAIQTDTTILSILETSFDLHYKAFNTLFTHYCCCSYFQF